MRTGISKWAAAAAALLVLGVASAARAPESIVAAGRCERACLLDIVNQYLAALVAHDPSRLPLRQGARFTENGQTLKLDDGLWGTIEGLGDYKLYFADPAEGEAGYFGTVRESGRLALLALRLKVQGKKISEIETLVARSSGPASLARFGDLKDKPIFHERLSRFDHPSREVLVSIANSYFEGLEQASGAITPFDPHCTRIENGAVTANNPSAPNVMARRTCGQQFDTGFSKFITEVRGRRFPVVDQDYGLVLAIGSFDHSGRIKTVKLTDGSTLKVPPPFDAPYSFLMAELFKIKARRITQIEAVIVTTPYAMPSGW